MRRSKRRKLVIDASNSEILKHIETNMKIEKRLEPWQINYFTKKPNRLWFLNVPRDLEITKTNERKLENGAIKVSVYFSGETRYKIVFNVFDPVKYHLSRIWKNADKSSEVKFECAKGSVSFLIWERVE